MNKSVQAAAQPQLIPVFTGQIGDQPAQLVNARDLHTFLQVGRDFTNWIKGRIRKYGFTENQDYALTLAKTGERQNVVQTDYHLTLDTAKELAMVENNDQGRAARRYFIECERALHTRQLRLQDTDRVQLASLLAGEVATVASRAVFEAVLAGDDDWKHRRFMFCLNYGPDNRQNRPWSGPIAPGAIMVSIDTLADQIARADGGYLYSNRQLARLAAACTQQLTGRIESQARVLANEGI